MQIVFNGDSVHEMSSPAFWGKKKKKSFNLSSAELAHAESGKAKVYQYLGYIRYSLSVSDYKG